MWPKVHYDPFKRNKIPFALRIRGSILVGMIPTLVLVAIWSSIVTYVHLYHHSLAVDSVLITVTGELWLPVVLHSTANPKKVWSPVWPLDSALTARTKDIARECMWIRFWSRVCMLATVVDKWLQELLDPVIESNSMH